MFIVKGQPISDNNICYPGDEFFDKIEEGGSFALTIELSVYEGEPARIYLLSEGRESLISGFPRIIVHSPFSV